MLSYTSNNATAQPASLGYGWSMGDYKSVVVNSAGQLQFNDGSGSYDLWSISQSNGTYTYTPTFQDNYLQASGNPTNGYTLTDLDLTVMSFRASDGKIIQVQDSNGNIVSYSYDSSNRLQTIADQFGRSKWFVYQGASLQPSSIHKQSATDPNRIELLYNTSGQLQSIHYPLTASTTYAYMSYTYTNDGKIANIYDAQNDPNTVSPALAAKAYTYNSLGQLSKEIDYGQRQLAYTYTTNSDNSITVLVTESDLVNTTNPPRTTTKTYNQRGLLSSTTDNENNTWATYYSQASIYQPTMGVGPESNASNPYLYQKFYDPYGNVAYNYDAYGNRTMYLYGGATYSNGTYSAGTLPYVSKLTGVVPPPVTLTGQTTTTTYQGTSLQYDSKGNLIQVTDTLNNSTLLSYVGRTDGLVTSITDRNGNIVTFDYTTLADNTNIGNLKKISYTSGATGQVPAAPVTFVQFSYDVYDNLLSATDALGNSVQYQYDLMSRRTLSQVVSPNQTVGSLTNYSYSLDRLSYLQIPGTQSAQNSNSARRQLQWGYDVAGRVNELQTQLVNGSLDTLVSYLFDSFSNLTQLSRLQQGVTKSWNMQYDDLNRIKSSTDPRNRQTTVTYPSYCKSSTVTSPQPNSQGSSQTISKTTNYDAMCRLINLERPNESDQIVYDEWGRVTQVIQQPNSPAVFGTAVFGQAQFSQPTLTKTFLYDGLSRLTQVNFPSGATVKYSYDNEGNVTSLTDANGLVTTYVYYPYSDYRLWKVIVGSQTWTYTYSGGAGRIYEIQHPNGIVACYHDANGQQTTYGWDFQGRLMGVRYSLNGTDFQTFQYQYDDSGNRTQIVDTFTNLAMNSTVSTTTSYTYDLRSRLSGVITSSQTKAYGYDQSDNLTSVNFVAGQSNYIYNYTTADELQNRQTGAGGTILDTYTTDNAGNLVSKTVGGVTTNLVWDDQNKLTAVQNSTGATLASAAYDAEGLRRSDGTVSELYYNAGSTSVSDSANAALGAISYIQGSQILGFQVNGSYYTYITDALGSVRHVADSNGNLKYSFVYDEFGNATATSRLTQSEPFWLAAACQKLTFVGAYGVRNETATTGMYLMGQRWYDPQLGRFISQDPIGFAGGLNLYNYASNAPTNFIDPSGLESYLILQDGTRVKVSTGPQFIDAVGKVNANNLITVIITRGHGGSDVADLSAGTNPDSLVSLAKGVLLQYHNGPGRVKYVSLKSLLKGKLAPGASFYLNDCNTAVGEDNIARSLSQDFPGGTVRGVNAGLDENRALLGGYYDQPDAHSKFQYYQAGNTIAGPDFGADLYMVFGQQSTEP